MTATVRPGELRVRVIVRSGHVATVEISSDRPLSLASRFVGRPVVAVVETVALLHGICGQSHAVAMHEAAAAAAGAPPSTDGRNIRLARLAAERIGEHLRGLISVNALPKDLSEDPAAACPQAFQSAQRLARGALPMTPAGIAPLMIALRQILDARPAEGVPLPAADCGPVDALTSADDWAVLEAMSADPFFLRHPSLPDRCPETGPAARAGRSAAVRGAASRARWDEIAAASKRLQAFAERGEDLAATGWIDTDRIAVDLGYAAVETPRGRLLYLVRVDEDGGLAEAAVLAPTEWNFHPQGPFARAIIGLPVADGLEELIRRRASEFDACVGVEIEVIHA